MNSLLREAMRWVNQLDRQEWLFVLIGVVIVGLVCLRGFGSRSQY
jgi:hypothetical protein